MPLILIFIAAVVIGEVHRSHASDARLSFPGDLTPKVQKSLAKKNLGRDGFTQAAAIILEGFPDEKCDPVEHAWLKAHVPDYRRGSWTYVWRDHKAFDIYQVFSPDGAEHQIYFDVTKIIQSMPDMTKPPATKPASPKVE